MLVPGNDGTTTVIDKTGVHHKTNQIPACLGKCADDHTPPPTKPVVGGGPPPTITVLNGGILIGPDGTLVDAQQYASLGICQALGPTSGADSGSPCGAWWKTEAKIFAAANGGPQDIFLTAGVVQEIADKYGQSYSAQGSLLVDWANNLDAAKLEAQGAIWAKGDFQLGLGDSLDKLGKVAQGLSVAVVVGNAFNEEVGQDKSGRPLPLELARGVFRSGLDLLGLGIGAAAGTTAGAAAGEALEPAGGGVPGGAIGAILGGATGQEAGDNLFEFLFGK